MTQKAPSQNPWTFDVRVRERNIRSGALTEKDLEKYVQALPDLEAQAESFAVAQPALEEPELDDEDEDEDEDDTSAASAPAADAADGDANA